MNTNVLFNMTVEDRGRYFSPIVTSCVDVHTYYSLALIDSSGTFILWYVDNVHGYDLVQGYDNYSSSSGNTIYEWNIPITDTKGKLLLLEKSNIPIVRRYDCLKESSILCDTVVSFTEDEDDKENTPLAPSWYGTFSSLSRSSIY